MSHGLPIPAIGPDVEDLPPRVLREKLRAGEQLVWWSRGQGSTFDFSQALFTLGSFLMLAAIAFGVFSLGIGRWAAVAFFSFMWAAFVLPSLLIGARYELYGLTNQRLLVIPGLPPAIWYALGPHPGLAGAIEKLEIKGSRERGNIRLQSAFGFHSPFKKSGMRLMGVKRPLDIAMLIKSTLKLSIPIEDRAR